MDNSCSFKVLVFGDAEVGKSNLMTRYVTNTFTTDAIPTIGIVYMRMSSKIRSKDVKITIVDVAGQKRFRPIEVGVFRQAHGAMLVYDITNLGSFRSIPTYLNDIQEFLLPKATVMLIGNKCDLEQSRAIQTDVAAKFAADNGLLFLELSALTSANVDAAFQLLIADIFKKTMCDGIALERLCGLTFFASAWIAANTDVFECEKMLTSVIDQKHRKAIPKRICTCM
jgi:small GTP-binding protein